MNTPGVGPQRVYLRQTRGEYGNTSFKTKANYHAAYLQDSFKVTSNLTLKYSLTDRLQLQLATANLLLGGGGVSARAFDGVSPGLKLVVLEEADAWPQLALSVPGVFPTVEVCGHRCTDGGIRSGTNADLVRGFITSPLERVIASADGIAFGERSGERPVAVVIELAIVEAGIGT